MTDNTEIKPFSPEQLQEKITNTVRANFGMLIPDEQFNALVDKEIKAFFEEPVPTNWATENSRGFGNDSIVKIKLQLTPFRYQIWTEVNKLIRNKIENAFNSPEFMAQINYGWDSSGQSQTMEAVLSDMLDKKLEELAPKMAASMFQQMFADAVSQAKMDIKTDLNNQGLNVY